LKFAHNLRKISNQNDYAKEAVSI